jgi:hypothetical protein
MSPLSGWQPAETAPEDGREFWYFARGQVRLGSLGHDLGSSIRRDPDMLAWHPKTTPYREEHPPMPPTLLP